MFTFDSQTGRLAAPAAGLTGGLIVYHCAEFKISSNQLKWRKTAAGYAADHLNCRLVLRLQDDVVSADLSNLGAAPVMLHEIAIRFHPADADAPMVAEDYFEFIQNNFGGGAGAKKVGLQNRWLDHNPESLMVYALRHQATGKTLFCGALPGHQGDYLVFRALHEAPHLQGHLGLLITSRQARQVPGGTQARTTPLRLTVGDDVFDLLEQHGAIFRRARTIKPKPVCRGWNSWDYFTGSVAAEDMFSNMQAARRLFGRRLKHLVIDAGWEQRWGAWAPNSKFPAGLHDFCRKTRAAGMVPGIWTAPALVNRYTRLYRDHPEWFARDAANQVASETLSYGPMSYLDITHPEARQWVYDTYRRLRHEGFEYFKVDFTQRVLKAERFHDPTVGRGRIIRLIFETVRQAIGNDAYLLSCGAPFQSVTGLVDAARVSDDIHNYWSHVLANVGDIASCWWLHRQAWNNDPDFAIVRSRETATSRHLNSVRPATPFVYKPVWMNGREMNLEEMRCYLMLVYLSAGELFLGDDLPGLQPNGTAMLRRIMQRPLRQAARPLDLFDSHAGLPSRFLARESDRAVLGLFNWEEDPVEHNISLRALGLSARAGLRDFWTGRPAPVHGDRLRICLPPRRCLGLVISDNSARAAQD